MVSLASQCLSEQVHEPQGGYSAMDNRRLMNAVLADYRGVEPDVTTQTLQNWMARMSLQNHAMPATRSANITERVSVPSSEHVAEIVGRQGCKIKALRDKTGTYIKTPVRGEEPIFIVTGRPEDVVTARKEILAAAEHFTQIRASRSRGGSGAHYGMPLSYGGLAAPARPPDNEVTIKVRVPYRVVGLVVGPKGSTIKRIQQTTNTFIVTPSRDREPCFEVTGTPQSVELARNEIETYIAMRTRNSDEEDPENGTRRSPGHRNSSTSRDGIHMRLGSTTSSGLVSPLLNDSESPFGPPSVLASAVDQLSCSPWSNYVGFSHFGVSGAQEQHDHVQNGGGQQHAQSVGGGQQRMVQTFPMSRPRSRGGSVASSHSQSYSMHHQQQQQQQQHHHQQQQQQQQQDQHGHHQHRPVGLSVSDPTSDGLGGGGRPRSNELIPDSLEGSAVSSYYTSGSIYGAVGSTTSSPSSSSANAYNMSLSTPSGSSSSAFETPESNATSSEEKASPPRKECYMCFADNGKEAALVPCGHLFCHSCAVQIYGHDANCCPVNGCGMEVEKILRIQSAE